MKTKEHKKLIRHCIANPTWAAHRILELEKQVVSLQEEVEELQESLDWAEEHGPRCRCINCAVPGAYEDD